MFRSVFPFPSEELTALSCFYMWLVMSEFSVETFARHSNIWTFIGACRQELKIGMCDKLSKPVVMSMLNKAHLISPGGGSGWVAFIVLLIINLAALCVLWFKKRGKPLLDLIFVLLQIQRPKKFHCVFRGQMTFSS